MVTGETLRPSSRASKNGYSINSVNMRHNSSIVSISRYESRQGWGGAHPMGIRVVESEGA